MMAVHEEKVYRFSSPDFVFVDAYEVSLERCHVGLLRDRLEDGTAGSIEEYFNDAFVLFLERLQHFKRLSLPVNDEEANDLVTLLDGLISAQKSLRANPQEKGKLLIHEHEELVQKIRQSLRKGVT